MTDLRHSTRPRFAIIIVIFMISLAGLMILHVRSQSEDIVTPIQVVLATPQGASEDGTAIREGDVAVYMPPNATNRDGTISITAAGRDPVTGDTEWVRPIIVNIEFRDPAGTPVSDITFLQPLEICFSLTDEQWAALTRDGRVFQVQTYAEEKNPPRWEPLPLTANPDGLELCGKTQQLSVFALAVKADGPVIGSTGIDVRTPMPTRTAIPAVQTQQRRDGASAEGGLTSVPTEPPARIPLPTLPPPTQVPPTPVPPTFTAQPEPTATEEPTEAPTQVPTEEEPTPSIIDTLLPILPDP